MKFTKEKYAQKQERLIEALKNKPMLEGELISKKIVSPGVLATLSVDFNFLAETDDGFLYLVGYDYGFEVTDRYKKK